MNRRVWIPIVIVLAFALAVIAVWSLRETMAPQTIALPNGLEYRFAGVTYGTNHVMGSSVAMAVGKLPGPLQKFGLQLLGSRTTKEPSLCVWLEPIGTNSPATQRPTSVYAILADENGVFAGERKYVPNSSGSGSAIWLDPEFVAVPRRSRILQCAFFEYPANGKLREIGRLKFRNPLVGVFPEWQPEPLPAMKMAGDVEVRLEQFSTGHGPRTTSQSFQDGRTITSYGIAQPGEDVRAAFELSFASPRGTNEVWGLEGAELSDPTGNRVIARSRSWTGEGWFAISPALWPNEPAWRLKLELERKSGFASKELAVFTNVAVPAVNQTDTLQLTNKTGGIQLVLQEFIRKPDLTNTSWNSADLSIIRIEHAKLPENVSIDFVEAVADSGAKLEPSGSGWSDTYYEVPFRTFPTNARRLNITFSVQRTRTVEFLVKPVVARPESE